MGAGDAACNRCLVSFPSVAETIETAGASIVLRRVVGPGARELFLLGRPAAGATSAREQSESIYRALLAVLAGEGATFGAVVAETVFLRNLQADVGSVRDARQQLLTAHSCAAHRPASTYIEQPPLEERASLEVSLQVVLPDEGPARSELVEVQPGCRCAECLDAHGLSVRLGTEARFYAAGLCGPGADAYEQTLGMFGLAERLLQQAGLEFSDVVRTWIYLRDIDRDYGDLNRARRAFFTHRAINPVPASTGIGGGPVAQGHNLCLGLYAVKAVGSPARTVMTSPTLNEAVQYGADFVRGMRVEEANKVALYISGTASIDEHGRTAHVGDFDAQADRMLVNIAALLERQGATFDDVVSAISYLKDPGHAGRLRKKLHEAGFSGFPHALVNAPICRSDLLCETEVIAVVRRR